MENYKKYSKNDFHTKMIFVEKDCSKLNGQVQETMHFSKDFSKYRNLMSQLHFMKIMLKPQKSCIGSS